MKRALIVAGVAGTIVAGVMLARSGAAPPNVDREGRVRTAEEQAAALRDMAARAALELDPVRPSEPPDPNHYVPPKALPHPEAPPESAAIRARALSRAIEDNLERPGETAFRTTVNAFMAHNRKFAEAQAQREGLTLEEVEELTYFGMMAQETQRWGEVEELLGRDLDQETRAQGERLMHELNGEFKTRMRQLVADGASAEERWRYLRETQSRYRAAYFALTGMNDQLLDDLLAGDASRAYSHATTPPPEEIPPADEEETDRERPLTPPE